MTKKDKTVENFDIFYEIALKDVIDSYYDAINKKEKSIILSRFIFFIILLIGVFIYIYVIDTGNWITGPVLNLVIIGLIFSALILIGTTIISLNKLMRNLKKNVIINLMAYITGESEDNLTFEPNTRLSRDSFSKMELFNLKNSRYDGKNFIQANYHGKNMVFSDIETYTSHIEVTQNISYSNGVKYIKYDTKRKKEVIFSGLYIGTSIGKNISSQIYLVPNDFKDKLWRGKMLKYIDFHGAKIELENLELSKNYLIFCDDEIAARYVLSLSFMEKINEIDKLFKCKKYIVFKKGKGLSICLQGYSIEKIMKIPFPYFKNEKKQFEKTQLMFENLYNLFKIYHILDLGSEVYSPDTHVK